jgi:clusterin-associated protein 1
MRNSPAFMDEYEKLEADLQQQYEVRKPPTVTGTKIAYQRPLQSYVEKFRNLSFLERELESHNQREQDKFEETERQLRRMQVRC